MNKEQLSKQLDSRYSTNFQIYSSKPSYFSKPLIKKLHKQQSVSKVSEMTILGKKIPYYPTVDCLDFDFTDALLFKNRVNAARRRKAKQRKK